MSDGVRTLYTDTLHTLDDQHLGCQGDRRKRHPQGRKSLSRNNVQRLEMLVQCVLE